VNAGVLLDFFDLLHYRVERRGRRLRLGLGPERALAGGLSRLGLLQPLVAALRAVREPFVAQRVL